METKPTAEQAREYLRKLSPGNKAAHRLLKQLSEESVIACAMRRAADRKETPWGGGQ